MKTFDEAGSESRILSNKGVMGEALKLNEHVFFAGSTVDPKKYKYLYKSLDTGEKIFTKNTLINPVAVRERDRPIAAIEINLKKETFNPDDYYTIQALTQCVARIMDNCFNLELCNAAIE